MWFRTKLSTRTDFVVFKFKPMEPIRIIFSGICRAYVMEPKLCDNECWVFHVSVKRLRIIVILSKKIWIGERIKGEGIQNSNDYSVFIIFCSSSNTCDISYVRMKWDMHHSNYKQVWNETWAFESHYQLGKNPNSTTIQRVMLNKVTLYIVGHQQFHACLQKKKENG